MTGFFYAYLSRLKHRHLVSCVVIQTGLCGSICGKLLGFIVTYFGPLYAFNDRQLRLFHF